MNNQNKKIKSYSLNLTIVLTVIISVFFIIFCFCAPIILKFLYSQAERYSGITVTIITFYCSLIPTAIILFFVLKMLLLIKKGVIFSNKVINSIKIISICFFVLVPITALGGYFYFPIWGLTVACAFFALIMCVVGNIISKATKIKEENDYTI